MAGYIFIPLIDNRYVLTRINRRLRTSQVRVLQWNVLSHGKNIWSRNRHDTYRRVSGASGITTTTPGDRSLQQSPDIWTCPRKRIYMLKIKWFNSRREVPIPIATSISNPMVRVICDVSICQLILTVSIDPYIHVIIIVQKHIPHQSPYQGRKEEKRGPSFS